MGYAFKFDIQFVHQGKHYTRLYNKPYMRIEVTRHGQILFTIPCQPDKTELLRKGDLNTLKKKIDEHNTHGPGARIVYD